MKQVTPKVKTIYFDMDGVLAKFNKSATPEQLLAPGYFRYLEPHAHMVDLLNRLYDAGVDVRVLSSVLGPKQAEDKMAWLMHYTRIAPECVVFVPYGTPKSNLCPTKTEESCLLDDYTPNLFAFEQAGGVAVKVLNGINHTKKRWQGAMVSALEPVSVEDLLYTVEMAAVQVALA